MTIKRDRKGSGHAVAWISVGLGLLVVAIAVLMTRPARPPAYTGPVRHVIVISLDTTRPDHLGCYGNTWVRTPRIDALAGESILLTDYMTVASTTLASHTSLFTGKYPHHHGVPRNGFVVHDDNLMLAEILGRAGFHTAGFLASFALDRRFNFDQGFEHFDENFNIFVGQNGADQNQRRAAAVTDAVIDYLDTAGVPRNLFLFVHYFDPHMPYAPPAPYDAMYGPGGIRPKNHPALTAGPASPEAMQKLLGYAGETTYMDEHLGRLLDDLKRRGVLDEALLIVTSDHGENLGDANGPAFDHGWTTYQALMHAVGIIRLPQAANGATRLDCDAASIDVVPTIVKYLGLELPAGVDGRPLDLADLSRNAAPRTRFGEATKPWNEVETDPRWYNTRKQRCVRTGDHKLVRADYLGREELYDIRTDPRERHNLLAAPTPDLLRTAGEMRRALEEWTDTADPLPTHFENSYYEDTVRRLQSLGYLSSGTEDADDEGD